jgi:pyruvate carboxylase
LVDGGSVFVNSVIPTRYFLGRPDTGEEMHISIEKGKTLIIRLMAVGPVVEGKADRDVWFEVNGEVIPVIMVQWCI